MAHGTQGDQLVQIEVGPTLGPLDDALEAGPLNLHFGFVSQNTIASFPDQRLTVDPCWPAMAISPC
jgi:hypothetical protein